MKKKLLTNTILTLTAIILIFTGCALVSKPTASKLSKSVQPLQLEDGRNYCTSSQISYKGKRFTMTNNHCCAADPIEQRDGSYSINVEGQLRKILYVSKINDLCLAEPTGKKPLTIANGETYPGDKVYMMGYPMGTGPVFEEGKILSKYDIIMVGFLNFFIVDQINIYTFPGNSGSAVLNQYGEVVGLIFAGLTEFPFYGSMVPLKLIKQDLDKYVKTSK